MNKQSDLPNVILTYMNAINSHDAHALRQIFAEDAVVKDVGREINGIAAITEWADRDIFGVNVTLEALTVTQHDLGTTITVKVDGTFDRTGLPDPLVMEQSFKIVGDKILRLNCEFVAE